MAGLFDEPLRGRLPLYEPEKALAKGIQPVAGSPRDPHCTRCKLGIAAKHPCLVGRPGSLGAPLVVSGSPTQHDDVFGALMAEGVGALISSVVSKACPGDWRLVWALGCPGPAGDKEVEACRPYLAAEFERRPPRAILLGGVAVQSALGIEFNAQRTRRAWCELKGVPTFLVLDPRSATFNRHVRRWLEQDILWAFTAPAHEAPRGETRVALSPAEAVTMLEELRPGEPVVVDVEHAGTLWAQEFRMLCVGFCQDPDRPFVLPAPVESAPEVVAAMRRVLEDVRFPKVNQWIKHDRHAIWRAYGIEIEGIEADTILVQRLLESDAPAGLKQLAWRVGMGGYKELGLLKEDAEDE